MNKKIKMIQKRIVKTGREGGRSEGGHERKNEKEGSSE